jgi:hypothetical protein
VLSASNRAFAGLGSRGAAVQRELSVRVEAVVTALRHPESLLMSHADVWMEMRHPCPPSVLQQPVDKGLVSERVMRSRQPINRSTPSVALLGPEGRSIMIFGAFQRRAARLLFACGVLMQPLASQSADSTFDGQQKEILNLIRNVGCGAQLDEVQSLAAKSVIHSRDPDWVTFNNSAVDEMMKDWVNGSPRHSDKKIAPEELILTFAIDPAVQISRIFPSRNKPSTSRQLTKAVNSQLESIGVPEALGYSKSQTVQLIRASGKLKYCLVDSLATPNISTYRADFDAAVTSHACRTPWLKVIRGVKPDYQEVVKSYYAIQWLAGAGPESVPASYMRLGGSALNLADRVFINAMTVRRLEEEKEGATLASNFDTRRLNQAKTRAANNEFWSCMAVPEAVKNDPQATFPLFIPTSTTKPGNCSLIVCHYILSEGDTNIECNMVAACQARSSSRISYRKMVGDEPGPEHGCPEAHSMNQAQLDGFFQKDGSSPLFCSSEP